MTEGTDPRNVQDLPGWVRRSWLVPLALGVLLVLIGVILLFNLGASLNTLRWLVVVTLLLAAAESFATASLRTRSWAGWLVGVLYALGALVGVVWPGVTLRALALTVGVSLLVAGGVRAGIAWQVRAEVRGWVWTFALGVLSVIAGLVFLLGNPVISFLVLAAALACYAMFSGFTLVMLSLAVRRLGGAVAAALSH